MCCKNCCKCLCNKNTSYQPEAEPEFVPPPPIHTDQEYKPSKTSIVIERIYWLSALLGVIAFIYWSWSYS